MMSYLKLLENSTKERRVIAFHEVKNRENFYRRIQWLNKNYDILPLADLLNVSDILPRKRVQIAITFDDGYESWYEIVLPVLKEMRVPATFFVCSGFIGLSGENLINFTNKRLKRKQILQPLSIAQLCKLTDEALFDIGSHTATHADLGEKCDLNQEITEDKIVLEKLTGRLVNWFSYPFGRMKNISPEAKDYLQKLGFRAAFTIIPGFIEKSSDMFLIGRDSLDCEMPDWFWKAWLGGVFDSFSKYKEKLLNL